jgi:dihydroorotase
VHGEVTSRDDETDREAAFIDAQSRWCRATSLELKIVLEHIITTTQACYAEVRDAGP